MNTKLLTGITLALTVVGCATMPPDYPALDTARSAVQSAEADPNVSKYAALDLQTAKTELEKADAAAMKHDEAGIDQPAYMATQTAHLAQLKASAKAEDARVAEGQTEEDEFNLPAAQTKSRAPPSPVTRRAKGPLRCSRRSMHLRRSPRIEDW